MDWPAIVRAFHQKMEFERLTFTGVAQMINDENDKRLQAAWKNSLAHQIPGDQLPSYLNVKENLLLLLDKTL